MILKLQQNLSLKCTQRKLMTKPNLLSSFPEMGPALKFLFMFLFVQKFKYMDLDLYIDVGGGFWQDQYRAIFIQKKSKSRLPLEKAQFSQCFRCYMMIVCDYNLNFQCKCLETNFLESQCPRVTRPKYWFSLNYSILLKTIDISKGVLSSWWL